VVPGWQCIEPNERGPLWLINESIINPQHRSYTIKDAIKKKLDFLVEIFFRNRKKRQLNIINYKTYLYVFRSSCVFRTIIVTLFDLNANQKF
jgi:hypothetical protein